jgi:hypothetical protein
MKNKETTMSNTTDKTFDERLSLQIEAVGRAKNKDTC